MKTVLITGTSSGFGMLTTLALAKAGYQVIATMRDLDKRYDLQSIAKRERVDSLIHFVKLDVTNQQHIATVPREIEERFGKLDILINNAGYCHAGFFEELEATDWHNQFATNVFGPIQVTKNFLPLLQKGGGGKLIMMSSISGFFGFPGLSPYTSSKFALEGLSESLRLELRPANIWVSLVEPASYQTKIWEKGLENINIEADRPDYQNNILNEAMKSKNGGANPQEVAQLIVKICGMEKPKFRYPVGKGARSLSVFKRIFPWSWIEGIVKKKLSVKGN
ncbi:SDR family oxidoreductase [Caldibacillus lycopersici]|uniref:SDR family oxidoreductase n=1 Tax=Perspicuibacillus lycopersici TaxID=1325689 RepID=A0AAE3LMF5_9BACI|nr:SDR family oxidoreductase [Perspicuibacillus lycopersici]MCU9613525.1 SDR family oxidoreductase [Perspicuibacillus lycopersici]